MGMAVGLIPIVGKVFTEIEAIKTVSNLEAVVIGRGGIDGAEGAAVFSVESPQEKCELLLKIIKTIKGASTSGDEESLEECKPGSPGCKNHMACIYRTGKY